MYNIVKSLYLCTTTKQKKNNTALIFKLKTKKKIKITLGEYIRYLAGY